MAKALQRRRGTTEEHKSFTGLEGEFTYDTTEKRIVAHDGSTAGGIPMAKVSEVNQVQTNLNNAKTELQNKVNEVAANAGDAFQEDILEAAKEAGASSTVSSGDISIDDVLADIEQAKIIAARDDERVTSIFAPLKSFVEGDFERILLFGGPEKSNWLGSGNITLSESWRNFDALVCFFTNDGNSSWINMSVVFPWQIQWLIDIATSSGKAYLFPFQTLAGSYWGWTPAGFGDTTLTGVAENSGIQAIYGIRFKKS